MKTCRRCLSEKPFGDFRSDPRNRDGLGSWCIQCHRERASEWARENRERLSRKQAERHHPLSGDNLFITASGARGCKECRKIHKLTYRSKAND